MKLELVTFKTYPSKKDKFWQIVIIPTISVLGNEENKDEYIAINFEWLFWSITLLISENGKKYIYQD
jgi:hypothetical protein